MNVGSGIEAAIGWFFHLGLGWVFLGGHWLVSAARMRRAGQQATPLVERYHRSIAMGFGCLFLGSSELAAAVGLPGLVFWVLAFAAAVALTLSFVLPQRDKRHRGAGEKG